MHEVFVMSARMWRDFSRRALILPVTVLVRAAWTT
jgi:hypothetical protein